MAYVDDSGLLWAEPGDRLRVEHKLRAHDYGPLVGGRPEWLIWHLTGNRIPEGCAASSCDGTDGMAGRVASGSAKYYAHAYLGRDGTLVQVVPFIHAAIHVAGSFQGKVVNRTSNGIEVTNWAYAHADDGDAPGFKIDPDRPDALPLGRLTWQMLSIAQNTAIPEIAEAWMKWTGRPVEDCIRGHHDVDTDSSHVDPGPILRPYLDGPVRAHLER
ncbi:MAG TPA: N-acetylmuramoyl-L-alanine amidase, partial [Geobacteraceae bacterium]